MDVDLVKILAGGSVATGCLAVLYLLLKPLIVSLVATNQSVVKTNLEIALTMQVLRDDLHKHYEEDRASDSAILSKIAGLSFPPCQFDPKSHGRRQRHG